MQKEKLVGVLIVQRNTSLVRTHNYSFFQTFCKERTEIRNLHRIGKQRLAKVLRLLLSVSTVRTHHLLSFSPLSCNTPLG